MLIHVFFNNYIVFQGFKSVIDTYGDLDNVCMFTLAPEIPNAIPVIEELCKRNIKVSLGKTSLISQ